MTVDPPEWFATITAAVAPIGLDTTIVIELRVEPARPMAESAIAAATPDPDDSPASGPREGSVWQVVLAPESSAHMGRPRVPDVVFSTDPETAAALASGSTNAQQSISAGRLRVRGDLRRLVGAAAELSSPR